MICLMIWLRIETAISESVSMMINDDYYVEGYGMIGDPWLVNF